MSRTSDYIILLLIVRASVIFPCESRIIAGHSLLPFTNLRVPQRAYAFDVVYTKRKHKYPYLLAFHKEGCEFCEDMLPLIERISAEYDLHVERMDVGDNRNYALMLRLDRRAKCRGLPFYYNLRTHRHICGATTYQNLVAWATDKHPSSTLPSALKAEEIIASYRKTGLYARIAAKIREILIEGEKRMIDRLNNV